MTFRRLGLMLCFSALIQPTLADEDRSNLSSYTKSLILLAKGVDKLTNFTAERIATNERYVLAKAMVRLAGGFYALMIAKEKFVVAAELGVREGKTHFGEDELTDLRYSLSCVSDILSGNDFRIAASMGLEGDDYARLLRQSIRGKESVLSELARDLKAAPSDPQLREKILKDGEKARDFADGLYKTAMEVAKRLDDKVPVKVNARVCDRPR
jgi:hypothetical protein